MTPGYHSAVSKLVDCRLVQVVRQLSWFCACKDILFCHMCVLVETIGLSDESSCSVTGMHSMLEMYRRIPSELSWGI